MSDVAVGTAATIESGNDSAVSWAAIAAGAIANAALTLALVAFGVGMGFSTTSPFSASGPSVGAFKLGTGVYLCVVAILASTVGGYIAGRLRTKWTGLHTDEVVFRDTAHGFMSWAFAAVLSAAFLGAATTTIVGGATAGATQPARAPTFYFADALFRSDNLSSQQGDANAQRIEAARILAKSMRDGALNPIDRAYLGKLVAARTGMSPSDAERRVDQVTAAARDTLDSARRNAGHLALWLTAAAFIGALAASLAALEGGQLRDGVWDRTFEGRRARGGHVVT
jgi:hypothetical protein